MHFEDLTIVTPIKNPLNLELFIKSMEWLLKKPNLLIVVDSGGGEALRKFCWRYFQKDCRMWEARKLGYAEVKTEFTLNLDSDTVLPLKYMEEALNLLKSDKAEAVAIDYEKLQGHYAFGTSIWKTEILRKLYDYPPNPVEKLIKVGKQEWVTAFQCGFCECTYMWSRLLGSGGRLETLPYRAKHLK